MIASKIVSMDKLSVRIPLRRGGHVHAATEICFKLQRGSIHAVIGESGCGKSIIAKSLTGLLPRSAVVSGDVFYDGESVFGREAQLAGRQIAFIPQSAPTFLTPVLTVGAQLEETVRVLDGKQNPAELMDRVNLSVDALNLYPHEISGGMAQRAAVAFALAGDPQVIVADEPTASLDPDLTHGILMLLREIADQGVAVMFITHDISELMDANVADEVSVVYASRIVETGEANALLFGQARHPYTQDLLKALPRNGLHPIKGPTPVLINLPEDYCYEKRLMSAGEQS